MWTSDEKLCVNNMTLQGMALVSIAWILLEKKVFTCTSLNKKRKYDTDSYKAECNIVVCYEIISRL